MPVDVGGALTRKIGPLPAWGWGVAVGGAALAVKLMRGGGGGGGGGGASDPTVIQVPTGGPSIPTDYIGQLGTLADWIRQEVNRLNTRTETIGEQVEDIGETVDKLAAGNPVSQPSASPSAPATSAKPINHGINAAYNFTTYIMGLRRRFPAAAASFGERERPGETAAQRTARLVRELAHYGPAALTDQLGTYVRGLRYRYPDIAKGFTERERAGETAAQRTARLTRELAYFRSRGAS